jgi:ubiquinone biosynthesis protein COQ9
MVQPASLNELRLLLAPAIADAAAFDGWSDVAVRDAASAAGLDPAAASFAFSGGSMQMIEAWVQAVDAAMQAALPADQIAQLKIRADLRRALPRAVDHGHAAERAPRTLALGWRSADKMWRLAGDTATDYNHYTKRMTLGSLFMPRRLAVYANDSSDDHADTKRLPRSPDRRRDEV